MPRCSYSCCRRLGNTNRENPSPDRRSSYRPCTYPDGDKVVHVDKADELVAEAFAFHVNGEERLLVHETSVKVVEHFCMPEFFHNSPSCDRHEVTVARLLVLLLVEVLHIRTPVLHHGRVVLIVTSGEDNGFISIEFYISPVS